MKKICILSSEKFEGKIVEDILLRDELKKAYECDIVAWERVTEDIINNFCIFIVRSVWGYHKNYTKFLNLILNIEKRGKCVLNSYENICDNISKYNQIKFFEQNNIPYVPTIFFDKDIKTTTNYNIFNADALVIKPSISASGANTIKINKLDLNNIYKIYDEILKDSNQKLLIQPYIKAIEKGEYSCIVIDNEFQYAVNRLPGIFTSQKGVKYIEEVPENIKIIVDNIIKVLKPLNLLFYRIDFLEYNNNYLVNELEMIDPDLFIKRLDVNLQEKEINKLSNLIIKKVKNLEV